MAMAKAFMESISEGPRSMIYIFNDEIGYIIEHMHNE
jgi:hypothetical protein